MLDFFYESVEYQGWGYNMLTLGAVGSLTLLVFEAWGMRAQVRKIFVERSAEGLSVHWFGYVAGFMLASLPYAIAISSTTLLLSASVFLWYHVKIIWGVYKFRGLRQSEVIGLGGYSLMLPAMTVFSGDLMEVVYLVCSLGNIWAFTMQPWKIWSEKDAGDVEVKMLVAFLASVTFWSIYGFAAGALGLMILNPILFVILTITIGLWFTYRH